ncbi:MAG: hypothetical protein WC917_03845 [Bacilli bacterium]|jgi:hypothetical protein
MEKIMEASGFAAKLPEGNVVQPINRTFEDKNVSVHKGGVPELSIEQQLLQLKSTVLRLEKELAMVKADLKDKVRDIEELWTNSDLLFANDQRLADKLHNSKPALSTGQKMQSRVERIAARLKAQGNAWLAKRDLHGWLGLKSRQLAHVVYRLCLTDKRFTVKKEGKYVYLRLRPIAGS